MPAPGVLRRLRGRRGLAVGGAVALVVLVLGVMLEPSVEPVVDWVMDGDLTPGVWEPRHWLVGTLLAALFLPFLGWPSALVAALVVAVSASVAAAAWPRGCPACGRAMDAAEGTCTDCGSLPPRRPRRAGRRVFARAMLGAVAGLLVFLPLVAYVAAGIGWVRLEREEDAFGERARAAAAAGERSYEETTRHGSVLWWRAAHGYGSHRD